MTATAEGTPATSRRPRPKASHAHTSFWSKDIGHRASDDDVDRPPFTPTLPRVNLLPRSVAESFTLRRIRRTFAAIAAIMMLAFGAVWYLQTNQIADAQAGLAQAQADNATVVERVNALAPIKEMYEQITGEQALVATTLASEPRAALVIARLVATGQAAGGGGRPIDFTSIAIEYRGVPEPGAGLNPCPNPDPFSSEITIGCVTFSGTASTRDQVSAMLSAIEADQIFVGPYVNNSTVMEETAGDKGGVMFTGTAGISMDALEKPLTDEQVQAILTPPTPAADATEQPGGGQ